MLRTDDWSFYEGFSEIDGKVVMKFYGQVDRNNPDNVLITEKEAEPDSYKKNADIIRQDRREFEDKVYFEASRLTGLNAMIDDEETSEEENCAQIPDNSSTLEGGEEL